MIQNIIPAQVQCSGILHLTTSPDVARSESVIIWRRVASSAANLDFLGIDDHHESTHVH